MVEWIKTLTKGKYMEKQVTKVALIDLYEHYKLKANIQHELGNFEEAKAYDDLAQTIDLQILDLMVAESETRIKTALIA
jgi:hypothetical protein